MRSVRQRTDSAIRPPDHRHMSMSLRFTSTPVDDAAQACETVLADIASLAERNADGAWVDANRVADLLTLLDAARQRCEEHWVAPPSRLAVVKR